MLEFQDVRISRDGQTRLGPVNLTLDPSKRTIILGHNGAGKSLFLRVAHGVLLPDAGKITWSGRPPASTRHERGFVFQNTPLMRRSVAQNVQFPLMAQGQSASASKAAVSRILEQAQLGKWADSPAATLSGGERQRLAVARALITEPKVMLLDEPAASLDPEATARLETLIMQANAAGMGIIMSTHDLDQAKRLAEDVLVFENGVVQVHSSAENFFSEQR